MRLSFLKGISLFFLIAAFSTASGCVHPCLALAESICECKESASEREACKRQARSLFDQSRRADTDEAREECTRLLEICDCTLLSTEQGKKDCGFSLETEQ